MDTHLLSAALSLLLLLNTAATHDEDGWSIKGPSEVQAVEGYPVVLPCSYTHPHHTKHPSVRIVWQVGHGQTATVLFQCTTLNDSNQCQTRKDQDQRYRLEGNHREHDLSLRIKSPALQDSGRYYCRIEVLGHHHVSIENKMGIWLRVEAAPRILSLRVESSEESGYIALCQVRGSPLPNIQWMGPEDVLEGDPASPLSQEGKGQHHTTSRLLGVQPEGYYTCAAFNSLGKDQATLYILKPDQQKRENFPSTLILLLSLSLGIKVLLSLGIGAWVAQGSLMSWVSCLKN
ncbi:sialic acid-binding Ig-like lectin 15 [Chanos chanos]|uniref:Sialic acid-binding Ig-like lectin 15 n=1 Tax=Chanos chanos TaxID=29144 RepID=A0A6J2W4I4_CHACN|nr:sialic acid-binding Ig-like lectin 15 [Chanos chanos]